MTKTSGLGDGLLVGANNASGDIQQVNNVSSPRGSFDFTGIDKFAMERDYGSKDGALAMTTFFNPGPAADAAHLVLSVLPRTDVQLAYLRGQHLGDAAAAMVAKQLNYDASRGTDGSLTFSVSSQANSRALQWGEQLTAGVNTDTAAGNGTGVDFTTVSTAFGWQAFFFLTAFTGTSVVVKLQDSADNVTFADLTAGAFASATAAGVQYLEGGRTDTVRRYLRVVSVGTFTSASYSVIFVRNNAQVIFQS